MFEFGCEWLNVLCVAEFPFGCSEIFVPFLLKFGQTFQNNFFFIIEYEWQIVDLIRMTCLWPNCHSAIHTQTQTETEGNWASTSYCIIAISPFDT